MLSIQQFIELQVVGLLLLFALSPLALAFVPRLRKLPGLCPGVDTTTTNSAAALMILVVAFVVGVAGNALVDEAVGQLHVEGKEAYRVRYEAWATADPLTARRLLRTGGLTTDSSTSVSPVPTLIVAADIVAGRNDVSQAYFERHRSLMRVLRGSAAAAFLFLLAILIHDRSRARDGEDHERTRYGLAIYGITAVALVVFSVAYRMESTSVYARACELATWNHDCEPPLPGGRADPHAIAYARTVADADADASSAARLVIDAEVLIVALVLMLRRDLRANAPFTDLLDDAHDAHGNGSRPVITPVRSRIHASFAHSYGPPRPDHEAR